MKSHIRRIRAKVFRILSLVQVWASGLRVGSLHAGCEGPSLVSGIHNPALGILVITRSCGSLDSSLVL